jgi:hypothetical protein
MKSKAPAILMFLGGLLLFFGGGESLNFDFLSPGVRPINAEGFRVMLVYDDSKLSLMPESEKSVIFSSEIRLYLEGKAEEFRFVSSKTDMSQDATYWKEAFERPRKDNPWLMISSGKTKGGYEGKMPKTIEATLSLLKKHAGG